MNGIVAHVRDNVEIPKMIIPIVSIIRDPNLSTAQPTGGDPAMDNMPPRLAAPLIKVLLQPNSSDIGYTKTANVRLPTAFLTNIDVPAAPTIYHP